MTSRLHNWAQTVRATTDNFFQPESAAEVGELVERTRSAGERMRVVGAGHSFTPLAVSADTIVNLDRMSGLVSVNGNRARFLAGTRLFQIPALLKPHGLALTNQGDVDPQALAGAISTGTHGTGLGYTGFGGVVTGLTLMTADGDILELSRDRNPHIFDFARLSLGVLGVILEVEIECVPTFDLIATETCEPIDELLDTFIERARTVDHTEFFWFPSADHAILKMNRRVSPDATADEQPRNKWAQKVTEELIDNVGLGVACEVGTWFPRTVPALNRLATQLASGRSYRAPAHEVFVSPRRVKFVETEFAVPLEAGAQTLRELKKLIDHNGWTMNFPLEVRVAGADDVPLSTSTGRESMYIAVHRYLKEDYTEVFRRIQRLFVEAGGRPHWGKMHTLGETELETLYPRFNEFRELREQLDPGSVFGNRYTDFLLGLNASAPEVAR